MENCFNAAKVADFAVRNGAMPWPLNDHTLVLSLPTGQMLSFDWFPDLALFCLMGVMA
tara:strand:- start:3424 stop:3597 length:174 start_codon:yes stop_codon:yes gene_type:complete